MSAAVAPAVAQDDAWAFVDTDHDGAVYISESPMDRADASASIFRPAPPPVEPAAAKETRPAAPPTPKASPSKAPDSLAVLKAFPLFACTKCKAHLASSTHLESKAFRGRHGAAYLFGTVANVGLGPVEERKLLTGLHTVRDVNCEGCSALLGWKYESAVEVPQKWKEGKYILEKAVIQKLEEEVRLPASADATHVASPHQSLRAPAPQPSRKEARRAGVKPPRRPEGAAPSASPPVQRQPRRGPGRAPANTSPSAAVTPWPAVHGTLQDPVACTASRTKTGLVEQAAASQYMTRKGTARAEWRAALAPKL